MTRGLTTEHFFSSRHSFRLAIPHRSHSAGSGARRWLAHPFQELLQHHGVVVLFILRCEQQCQPLPLIRQTIEFIERSRTFWPRQLFQVTPTKRCPASGTGVKPLAQSVRGCQVAQPFIDRGTIFGQTAWPQAVYQHARSVRARGCFVHSLHRYSFRSHSLHRVRAWVCFIIVTVCFCV